MDKTDYNAIAILTIHGRHEGLVYGHWHEHADRDWQTDACWEVPLVADVSELVVAHEAVRVELESVGGWKGRAVVGGARDQHLTGIKHRRRHESPALWRGNIQAYIHYIYNSDSNEQQSQHLKYYYKIY